MKFLLIFILKITKSKLSFQFISLHYSKQFKEIQWKLLNVITLGQTKTDNIMQMITITFTVTYYNNERMGRMKSDHIKRLPQFHCNIIPEKRTNTF